LPGFSIEWKQNTKHWMDKLLWLVLLVTWIFFPFVFCFMRHLCKETLFCSFKYIYNQ
jgi:hypothetical protein